MSEHSHKKQTQQTFVGLQGVSKTSSRHVLKTSSTRLQRNNFSSSKTSCEMSSKRLQDVFKTSWGLLGRQKVVTLKTSWRRLGNKQNGYWYICIKPWPTNQSKSVSNKSISHKSLFHESKANPKCIN